MKKVTKKPLLLAFAIFAGVFLSLGQMPALADDIYVDDDNLCDNSSPCYTTIGAAINAASSGDTITVYDGEYDEAVIIDGKDLSLIAFGLATLLPTDCTVHGDVIQVYNATVSIDGFTINANYSSSGCLGGIYVRSMDMWGEDPATAVISNNTIFNYGKNGITANGSGATASILNNTVIGRGPIGVPDWAQNGVQFGWGASVMSS